MRYKILILSFLMIKGSVAQDLIVLKDGNEINSKVLEVNISDIKYKKTDNLDGPMYLVLKSEVFMIKYKNGTKDIINSLKVSDQPIKSSQEIFSSEILTKDGTFEIGGNFDFSSQSSKYSTFNAIDFNPFFGIMFSKGFELGISSNFANYAYSGKQSTTQFNLYLAPTFNFYKGKTIPFIEILIGVNSISQQISRSGLGIGGSAGVKVQVGNNVALINSIKYLNQSYGESSNLSNVSLSTGIRFFIFPKK